MTLNEYFSPLRGRRVAVIGLGVSNLPLTRLLLSLGIDVTARDKRTRAELGDTALELESLGARLISGEHYLKDLTEDVIFRTPGLMPHTPELADAARRGAVITSEMEAFFDICPCDIIAVTGSDGKTTTTTLISEFLRAEGKTVHIGGNIGAPLLEGADSISADDFAVIELSSFQLITMRRSPKTAVVTNISPNHLDVHRDVEEYAAAKRNILIHQSPPCRAVLNFDDAATRALNKYACGELLHFSRHFKPQRGVYLDGTMIKYTDGGDGEDILSTSDIIIPGAHNIENYMAAIAATRGLVSRGAIQRTARSFRGVEHRIELVRELRGVKYYNNSSDSSPSRMSAALRAFPDKVILIAGGKDKGIPYDAAGPAICEHVKMLVLTGLTAEKIRDATLASPDFNGTPKIIMEPDFKLAVMAAHKAARPGDVVLLSPGSTSFDRFNNFAERGNYFKELVNGLD
ncbi:MAG: UDP-N-acetylmuramoyl-L-alanine--D-glutamate ligase [Oscillospiraceae bacterium]|nr:UDP-N-acetylmuramoyl-L-alanine--D-glutamate ligase [Oscillospiraceae bacterium]